MCCSRYILSWINTLYIIVLFSKLVRLNFWKKQNEEQGSSFHFLSLLILWFLRCLCTALHRSYHIGTFHLTSHWRLHHPFFPFHYVFMLLPHPDFFPISSHALPTAITCAGMPLLSCSLWHTLPCLISWICRAKSSWCESLSAICAVANGVEIVSTICQWASPDESHLWVDPY